MAWVQLSRHGGYWREIRKHAFLSLFNVKRVQSYMIIREEEVTLLVHAISHSSSIATPIDISGNLFVPISSITFRTAFSKSFHVLSD